jgi:hypothetical protein
LFGYGLNGDLGHARRKPAPTRVCCGDDAGLLVGHEEGHAVGGLNCQHQLAVVGDDDIGVGQLVCVMPSTGALDHDGCAVDLVKARKVRGWGAKGIGHSCPGSGSIVIELI